MTGAETADLRRQWEAAVDRAWGALNADQAQEAMAEEERLWNAMVAQTPKAEESSLGLRQRIERGSPDAPRS